MGEVARRDDDEATGTLAVPSGFDPGLDGLEDFDVTTDAVMPRLRIIGKDAVFEDNLTGETHGKIRVVLLGLVKQRILWDEDVKEGDGPLCRSNNFQEGIPFLKDFPWKASGFDRDEYDHRDAEQGQVALPCANCQLKEWGTNPSSKTPWCSEQHTFPLLMLDEDDNGMPAVLTLQRSAIKASKAYVSGFARQRIPLYTTVTEITLKAQRRGSVDYATPTIVKAGETDPAMWPSYGEQYRAIREFLTSRREASEDGDSDKAADKGRDDRGGRSRDRDDRGSRSSRDDRDDDRGRSRDREPAASARYDDEEPPF